MYINIFSSNRYIRAIIIIYIYIYTSYNARCLKRLCQSSHCHYLIFINYYLIINILIVFNETSVLQQLTHTLYRIQLYTYKTQTFFLYDS